MFLPFKTITTRQSVAYAALCLALMGGIKYLDDHTPEHNPQTASNDRLAWSAMDEQAARGSKKTS